jgi:hypothetical protein
VERVDCAVIVRSLLLALLALLLLAAPAAAAEPWAPLPGEAVDLGVGGAVEEGACLAARATVQTPVASAAQRGPSVKARIRSARREKAITADDAARYERIYDAALRARRRLGGRRRAELASVVRTLGIFARQRTLTVSRMPVLFRQLEQNTRWWSRHAPPRPAKPDSRPCAGGTGQGGARVVDRETVFQWYPGQGLQTMQLATAGRANALVKACIEPNPRLPCDKDRVRVAMEDLLTSSAERAGGRAWEAYFPFGGGRPPWVSGLWQGTAMQALARGSQVLAEPRYLEAAREGLGVFRTRPPAGVRLPVGAGVHYLGYSFNRGLRIYNQFLQALVGLYDVAEISGDEEARTLFRDGDRRARQELAGADTGAWTRYSANGAESDLGYHQLLRDFVRSLCDRTKASEYCASADRFHRYLRQDPGLKALPGGRFFLTKISCVTVTVSRGGRVVRSFTRVLRRGAHPIGVSGNTVRITARDLANNTAQLRISR